MAGIVSYGGYVPLYRLGPGTSGWKAANEKAVASWDEDSLTMAVAAAIDCLRGKEASAVDGIYFATTTPPYEEKLNATTIACAADLRRDVYAADFGNSLRAGTIALKAALDAVQAGTLGSALVVASDLRVAPPGSQFEPLFGDAAAAVLVGKGGVAVEVEASHFISDELLDVWRAKGDAFVRSAEDRFTLDEGYTKVAPEAISGLLKKTGLTARDFSKIVLTGPSPRKVQDVATSLGFDAKQQLRDPLFAAVGHSGTAAALLGLVAVLEQAKAGDRILVANHGNGADALALKVTEGIANAQGKSRFVSWLGAKQIMGDYATYQRWRGLATQAGGPRRPPPPIPSVPSLKREEKMILGLNGQRCKECGTIQFPPQRVCTSCHAKDNYEDIRLAEGKASLFTYGMDYLTTVPDVPNVIGIIDFDGGGRMMAAMTDRDTSKLSVGMPLEMTFRRLITVDGIHNYYWKCMPVRGQ